MERYFVSMLVDNQDGVLNRISNFFSRRGYLINSLSFAEAENPDYSRMTIIFSSNNKLITQITSQIKKVIDVKEIEEFRLAENKI